MKFCGNCGAQLEDGAQYCPYCGSACENAARQTGDDGTQTGRTEQTGHTAWAQSAEPVRQSAACKKTNGFAVAGFVMGLISITFGWCCCFGITQILGIVFSAVALSQIKKTGENGKGLAIAGLTISILCIVLLILLFFVGLSADLFDYYGYYDYYDNFGEPFPSI